MTDQTRLRRFHSACWDEQLLTDMSVDGERGILVPTPEREIMDAFHSLDGLVPASVARDRPPNLPELAQPQVVRHFSRLSQMTMGGDVQSDIGQGTCTTKYNPKVNERLAGLPQMTEMHPLQPVETAQGILEILHRARGFMMEIAGMDEVSFQPGHGGQAVMAAAAMVKAYHEARGEAHQRDQVITTIHSHPCNPSGPAAVGYEVITLWPDDRGYPDLAALEAVVSDRTAAIFITNPEDVGLYNPQIDQIVDIVHGAGGLCYTDQANLNGVIGRARAGDAGFDMCHFNLHKTFATPHGSHGPGCAALCVSDYLARYLPLPIVTFDGHSYGLDFDRPDSIGRVKDFVGNAMVVLRAYAWVMNLGAEGLKQVADTTVLNNNYLAELLLGIPGVEYSYGTDDRRRLDQIRFTLEKITRDTGITAADLSTRITDFGLQKFWLSHHPVTVPEPCTPEPTETNSLQELEEWAAAMRQMVEEAYETPDVIRTAPHNGVTTRLDRSYLERPELTYVTWRQWKHATEKAASVS